MELRELIETLQTAKGYMISATVLGKNNDLTHHLIYDKFQLLDLLPSHNEIKKLIVNELENPPQEDTNAQPFDISDKS